jgi:hypothetical protein
MTVQVPGSFGFILKRVRCFDGHLPRMHTLHMIGHGRLAVSVGSDRSAHTSWIVLSPLLLVCHALDNLVRSPLRVWN